MCEHKYIWVKLNALETSICSLCWKTQREIDLEQQLAAANARVAELHDDEAMEKAYQDGFNNGKAAANKRLDELEEQIGFYKRQLTDANHRIAVMHKNNEATVKRVVAEVDALNQRAEQAEAQCAAMRNCANCNKWCMKQPNKSEFDTLNRMDDCKLSGLSKWEPLKKLEACTALLDKNRRMREQISTYEQAITDVCKVINKVKCDINYPRRKELCLELNKLCRLLRESHKKEETTC
jgi:chromosome segregation ATPase